MRAAACSPTEPLLAREKRLQLHHAAELIGRDFDDERLEWLVDFAIDGLQNHFGLAHRELVALAAHVFDQDREVQHAAAGDREGVAAFDLANAEGDVPFQLEDAMALTETLVRECTRTILGKTAIDYQGKSVDVGSPFPRVRLEATLERLGLPRDSLRNEGLLRDLCKRNGIEAHREHAQKELSKPAGEGDAIGDLIGAVFSNRSDSFEDLVVATKLTTSEGDKPVLECWGVFSQFFCSKPAA